MEANASTPIQPEPKPVAITAHIHRAHLVPPPLPFSRQQQAIYGNRAQGFHFINSRFLPAKQLEMGISLDVSQHDSSSLVTQGREKGGKGWNRRLPHNRRTRTQPTILDIAQQHLAHAPRHKHNPDVSYPHGLARYTITSWPSFPNRNPMRRHCAASKAAEKGTRRRLEESSPLSLPGSNETRNCGLLQRATAHQRMRHSNAPTSIQCLGAQPRAGTDSWGSPP